MMEMEYTPDFTGQVIKCGKIDRKLKNEDLTLDTCFREARFVKEEKIIKNIQQQRQRMRRKQQGCANNNVCGLKGSLEKTLSLRASQQKQFDQRPKGLTTSKQPKPRPKTSSNMLISSTLSDAIKLQSSVRPKKQEAKQNPKVLSTSRTGGAAHITKMSLGKSNNRNATEPSPNKPVSNSSNSKRGRSSPNRQNQEKSPPRSKVVENGLKSSSIRRNKGERVQTISASSSSDRRRRGSPNLIPDSRRDSSTQQSRRTNSRNSVDLKRNQACSDNRKAYNMETKPNGIRSSTSIPKKSGSWHARSSSTKDKDKRLVVRQASEYLRR